MPSATATSPIASSTRYASSFPSRTRPTSVAAPVTSLTAPASPQPSPDCLGDGLPELHVVTPAELGGVHQRLAVEQRAVARPEVFHVDRPVAPEHPRVDGGDEGVVGEHDPAPAAATDGELVGEREALAVARRRFEDPQAAGTTALGRLRRAGRRHG